MTATKCLPSVTFFLSCFRFLFVNDSDLIYRMLQIHPDDRISVTDALNHPYLRDFSGQMPEPNSESLFEFDFEDLIVSKADLQSMMYLEMLSYRPNAGSVNDIPPIIRTRLASYIHGNAGGLGGMCRSEGKMDEDSGDEMHTAREYEDYKHGGEDYKSGHK